MVKIEVGQILLAEPFMADPNFMRTAVLIVDHHTEEGTVGLILNRPIDKNVTELVEHFPKIESNVFVGGPVGWDTLNYIHDVGDILDGSVQIGDNVYWGGNYDKLKFLIKSNLILPRNIRFIIGYSGWSQGQLEAEFEMGSWMQTDLDFNYIFSVSPNELWRIATRNIGGNYQVISEMPVAERMN